MKKFFKTRYGEFKEDFEKSEERRKLARAAAFKVKEREAVKTAEFKAKQYGKRERKGSGSFFSKAGDFAGGFDSRGFTEALVGKPEKKKKGFDLDKII